MLKTPKIGLTMQWAALGGFSPLSFDFWVSRAVCHWSLGFCQSFWSLPGHNDEIDEENDENYDYIIDWSSKALKLWSFEASKLRSFEAFVTVIKISIFGFENSTLVVIMQYISLVTFFALLVSILLGKILDHPRSGILVQLHPLQKWIFWCLAESSKLASLVSQPQRPQPSSSTSRSHACHIFAL